jgi:UDP-N-acetylmuramate dehydrogenase
LNLAEIAREIELLAGQGSVIMDEPMEFHTSFRVGGPADILVSPGSAESFIKVVKFCIRESIPFFVIGNGTNLLVRDGGIKGVVIKTCDGLVGCQAEEDCRVKAEAGAKLSKIAHIAYENSLAGFEFAAGIPGTLGGAVAMNAGAYDREMKDVIIETTCIDDKGELVTLSGEQHEFGYRSSIMQQRGYIVVESVIKLEAGNRSEIKALMQELENRRKDKQPLDFPSAGSIFKRPEGNYAGKLIECCGLRGATEGGAQVSEKHCGFIINRGNATALDIIKLINRIRKAVMDKYGIDLQPEVKIIGEDNTG